MIIFDTETDGLNKPSAVPLEQQPSMIEFAAVKLNAELQEVDRAQFFVKPPRLLSEECKKITRMTDEQLKDAYPFAAHWQDLCQFFLGEQTMLSHFLSFDSSVLRYELMRIGKEFRFPWPPMQVCTVEASKAIKGHNLSLSDLHMMVTGKQERVPFAAGHYVKHKSLGKCLILEVGAKLAKVKRDYGEVRELKLEMLKGAAFEGAHGAMKDVLILTDCVRWLKKEGYL